MLTVWYQFRVHSFSESVLGFEFRQTFIQGHSPGTAKDFKLNRCFIEGCWETSWDDDLIGNRVQLRDSWPTKKLSPVSVPPADLIHGCVRWKKNSGQEISFMSTIMSSFFHKVFFMSWIMIMFVIQGINQSYQSKPVIISFSLWLIVKRWDWFDRKKKLASLSCGIIDRSDKCSCNHMWGRWWRRG